MGKTNLICICPIKICIMGWYGKGNLGDEALLSCIKNEIYLTFPNAKIIAFCANSRNVVPEKNFVVYNRTPFDHLVLKLRAVISAKIFILGGGTMLCDNPTLSKSISSIAAMMF